MRISEVINDHDNKMKRMERKTSLFARNEVAENKLEDVIKGESKENTIEEDIQKAINIWGDNTPRKATLPCANKKVAKIKRLFND